MTVRTTWGLIGVAVGLPIALISSSLVLGVCLFYMEVTENSSWMDLGFWLSRGTFVLAWIAVVWLSLRKGEAVETSLRGAEESRLSLTRARLEWTFYVWMVISAVVSVAAWNVIKAVMPFRDAP